MHFKKEVFKKAALYLFNAVKVFIHKLSLFPWRSVPGKVKTFCKNAISVVKMAAFHVKRIAQCIVLVSKRVTPHIVLALRRMAQGIVLASKSTAQCIGMVGKRIEQCVVILAKYAAQCKPLLIKKAWPVVKIIFPPLVTGALIFTALNGSGLVRAMIDDLSPVTGFVPAALLLLVISLIPVISPLVGPGIIIAVLAVILTGEQIAAGAVTPLMALPAFCAIDVLIGGKIIPRAFAMGETEPETIDAGVPMVFFTRLITIPAAVAVAYLFSFILFQS